MITPQSDGRLVRIAVFFDGGYFNEVSRYYKYHHPRGARISVDGIQDFVRQQVALIEKEDDTHCQIVESHYFRGRFSAEAAEAAGRLKDQAAFDDVLIRAGIVQHYLPVVQNVRTGRPQERAVDVWLSLEAYDLAIHQRCDVLALIACDGAYVPLVRKLHGAGTRTMLLAWDFSYEFQSPAGREVLRETRTAQPLIEVCTYPVMMTALIDDRSRKGDPLIDAIFV